MQRFVAAMENVLETYQRPLDTEFPVVNMDEQPVQLKADLRDPQPMKPGQVERVDSEYKRKGVVSLFLIYRGAFLGGVKFRCENNGQRWTGQKRSR